MLEFIGDCGGCGGGGENDLLHGIENVNEESREPLFKVMARWWSIIGVCVRNDCLPQASSAALVNLKWLVSNSKSC